MNNERKLINYINELYKVFSEDGVEFTDEQKMIFETGIAHGITFALTRLVDTNIDLKVLGQYGEEN